MNSKRAQPWWLDSRNRDLRNSPDRFNAAEVEVFDYQAQPPFDAGEF